MPRFWGFGNNRQRQEVPPRLEQRWGSGHCCGFKCLCPIASRNQDRKQHMGRLYAAYSGHLCLAGRPLDPTNLQPPLVIIHSRCFPNKTMPWGQGWQKTGQREAPGALSQPHWCLSVTSTPTRSAWELEYQFCKEETGKLQYQVPAVWPPGCLPALSQGSLCQEMPRSGMFPSPSSSASLLLCPAPSSPPRAATPAGSTREGPCRQQHRAALPPWDQGKPPLALAASK